MDLSIWDAKVEKEDESEMMELPPPALVPKGISSVHTSKLDPGRPSYPKKDSMIAVETEPMSPVRAAPRLQDVSTNRTGMQAFSSFDATAARNDLYDGFNHKRINDGRGLVPTRRGLAPLEVFGHGEVATFRQQVAPQSAMSEPLRRNPEKVEVSTRAIASHEKKTIQRGMGRVSRRDDVEHTSASTMLFHTLARTIFGKIMIKHAEELNVTTSGIMDDGMRARPKQSTLKLASDAGMRPIDPTMQHFKTLVMPAQKPSMGDGDSQQLPHVLKHSDDGTRQARIEGAVAPLRPDSKVMPFKPHDASVIVGTSIPIAKFTRRSRNAFTKLLSTFLTPVLQHKQTRIPSHLLRKDNNRIRTFLPGHSLVPAATSRSAYTVSASDARRSALPSVQSLGDRMTLGVRRWLSSNDDRVHSLLPPGSMEEVEQRAPVAKATRRGHRTSVQGRMGTAALLDEQRRPMETTGDRVASSVEHVKRPPVEGGTQRRADVQTIRTAEKPEFVASSPRSAGSNLFVPNDIVSEFRSKRQ